MGEKSRCSNYGLLSYLWYYIWKDMMQDAFKTMPRWICS